MSEEQLSIIEELVNEEIKEYFRSGYGIDNHYIIQLREILKYFRLKEWWDYDNWK